MDRNTANPCLMGATSLVQVRLGRFSPMNRPKAADSTTYTMGTTTTSAA